MNSWAMLIDQIDLVNNTTLYIALPKGSARVCWGIYMDKDMIKALATATGAGVTMLSCIGGFVWIGYEIDGYFHSAPICMLILGLIGAITGMYMMYKQVK